MSQEQVISNAEKPRKSDNENYPHSPAYGVMQINDQPATAIQFERVDVNGNRHFNVNFMLDEKPVAQLRELDAEGLADAVGDKNAAFILARSEPSGSLKGEALVNEYGLSPDENNRRMMAKEERKGAILDPEALASVAAKREADTLAASKELSEHRQEALNAIAKAQRKP